MATFNTEDTIVARATPPGRGGIGVVRISGGKVRFIAEQVAGQLPQPRLATYVDFRAPQEGEVIDTGLALFFPAPHSFTGEDVLELQCHGSPVVVEMLLEAVQSAGARLAEAGEFSRRAFLNDKIDLAQAEAIADLIDSASRAAARAARRSMQGRFSEVVLALNEEVTLLRVFVEAALDFPEEEIDFLSDEKLLARLEHLRTTFDEVEKTIQQGCLLRDGVTVVLAGRPNAGKSSLLNALAGYDAAIVTDIEGTTRDLVREQIEIHGLPVNIIDTAGLRSAADAVEEEGVRRAHRELGQADHALLIVDAAASDENTVAALRAELPPGAACTLVRNKIDLTGEPAGTDIHTDTVAVSALTGAGIDDLRRHLEIKLGYQPAAEGSVIARDDSAIWKAYPWRAQSQKTFRSCLPGAGLIPQRVNSWRRVGAPVRLGRTKVVAGTEFSGGQLPAVPAASSLDSDDLLGRIFESFCIGK